ncbi:MAG: PLP-dependent aminotransferase family protein [Pyrinomonadaceae bacterium]
MKQPPPFLLLDDNNANLPLYLRIYDSIRMSILNGEFESQMRLPASRTLAEELGVSRMTVMNAYEQLFAEGYLEGKVGAGTFVASRLPEEYLLAAGLNDETKTMPLARREIKLSPYGAYVSENAARILENQGAGSAVPFQHSLPAMDEFPFEIWSKITQRLHKYANKSLGGFGDSAGFGPLREAVASYLRSARGVVCGPGEIIITNGAQQALDLVGRVLLSHGDRVWVEDPGYLGAKDIFAATGASLVPVPVDNEGFDLKKAVEIAPGADLAYVTPSRHFPLGTTMSLQRRLRLLEWAREKGGWIIEDDYDSEYRYAGRPLASLQGLDRAGRVIYIGTFSKTIFSALRLGCMVVPSDLIDLFRTARSLTDQHSPITEQAVLAEFISEGHFARHVRKMRTLYRKRQEILIGEIEKRLGGMLEVSKAEAGMQIVAWLPEGVCDKAVSLELTRYGIRAAPASEYAVKPLARGGLLLGYTAFSEQQIRTGVKKMAEVLTRFVGAWV